jgi:hypothetical protein
MTSFLPYFISDSYRHQDSDLRELDDRSKLRLSELFSDVLPALASKNHSEIRRVLNGFSSFDDYSISINVWNEIEKAMKLLRSAHVIVGEIARIRDVLIKIPEVLADASEDSADNRDQLLKELLVLDQRDMYVVLKNTVQETIAVLGRM